MTFQLTRAILEGSKFSSLSPYISDQTIADINKSPTLLGQLEAYQGDAKVFSVVVDTTPGAGARFDIPTLATDGTVLSNGGITLSSWMMTSAENVVSLLSHELGHYAVEGPGGLLAVARANAIAEGSVEHYQQACYLTEGAARYNTGIVLMEIKAGLGTDFTLGNVNVDVVKAFQSINGLVIEPQDVSLATMYALGDLNKKEIVSGPGPSGVPEDYAQFCQRTSSDVIHRSAVLAPGAVLSGGTLLQVGDPTAPDVFTFSLKETYGSTSVETVCRPDSDVTVQYSAPDIRIVFDIDGAGNNADYDTRVANFDGTTGTQINQVDRLVDEEGNALATISGTIDIAFDDTQVTVKAGSDASIEGDGNSIDLETTAQLHLSGNGNSVQVDGDFVVVEEDGLSNSIAVAADFSSVTANGEGVTVEVLGDGSSVNVHGSGDFVQIAGDNNSVTVDGDSNVSEIEGNGNTILISDQGGSTLVTGSDNQTLVTGSAHTVTVTGSLNYTIDNGSGDTIYVEASQNYVATEGAIGERAVVYVNAASTILGAPDSSNFVGANADDVVSTLLLPTAAIGSFALDATATGFVWDDGQGNFGRMSLDGIEYNYWEAAGIGLERHSWRDSSGDNGWAVSNELGEVISREIYDYGMFTSTTGVGPHEGWVYTHDGAGETAVNGVVTELWEDWGTAGPIRMGVSTNSGMYMAGGCTFRYEEWPDVSNNIWMQSVDVPWMMEWDNLGGVEEFLWDSTSTYTENMTEWAVIDPMPQFQFELYEFYYG